MAALSSSCCRRVRPCYGAARFLERQKKNGQAGAAAGGGEAQAVRARLPSEDMSRGTVTARERGAATPPVGSQPCKNGW